MAQFDINVNNFMFKWRVTKRGEGNNTHKYLFHIYALKTQEREKNRGIQPKIY